MCASFPTIRNLTLCYLDSLALVLKPAYSVCCAYMLAMINCIDYPVTNVGQNPDAKFKNYKCSVRYAIDKIDFLGIC